MWYSLYLYVLLVRKVSFHFFPWYGFGEESVLGFGEARRESNSFKCGTHLPVNTFCPIQKWICSIASLIPRPECNETILFFEIYICNIPSVSAINNDDIDTINHQLIPMSRFWTCYFLQYEDLWGGFWVFQVISDPHPYHTTCSVNYTFSLSFIIFFTPLQISQYFPFFFLSADVPYSFCI